MVIMRHEGRDLMFEIAGEVLALEHDTVLERLMPALDLALDLRVIGGAVDVPYFLPVQPPARSSATYEAPLSDNKRGR